ncbi:MAG: hypothetical protein ABI460_14515, partial [Caldimonas sp.]
MNSTAVATGAALPLRAAPARPHLDKKPADPAGGIERGLRDGVRAADRGDPLEPWHLSEYVRNKQFSPEVVPALA